MPAYARVDGRAGECCAKSSRIRSISRRSWLAISRVKPWRMRMRWITRSVRLSGMDGKEEVRGVEWHGVGGTQPAALPQAIGKIVKSKGRGCWIFEFPTEAGDSALAIVDDPE